MKRYKLLKDLPFAKAGEEFEIYHSDDYKYLHLFRNEEEYYRIKIGLYFRKMHDEWFEKIEQYFTIDFFKLQVIEININKIPEQKINNLRSVGMLFSIKEKAEKYLEFLKAKEVIKGDTEDFRPDWLDVGKSKYYGCWDYVENKPCFEYIYLGKNQDIFFMTMADIEKSFKKHPDEWKTYLTYEQQN